MDIFLSLLFSEERMFFFSLISVQSFQENLISGENVPGTLYSAFARGSCWLNFFGLLKSAFLLPTISHGGERLSQR